MAEIAIAAVVAAAVAGAAYTIEYALTPKAKPIEKGRLSGDLLVQDSRYGHLIPILLGGNPITALEECTLGYEHPVTWVERQNVGIDPTDHKLARSGGTPGTTDAYGYSSRWVPANGCGYWRWRVELPTESDEIYVVLEDEDGGVNKYGWYFTNNTVNFRRAPYHGAGADFPIYFQNLILGYNDFAIELDGDTVTLFETGEFETDPDAPLFQSYSYNGLDTSKRWRVRAYIKSADGKLQTITEQIGITELSGPGGLRVAGNVIALSDVRKVETTTPAEGKGFGNKNPDTISVSYYADLAIMLGEGELGLNKLYAGTDLLLALDSLTGSTGARISGAPADPAADNIALIDPSSDYIDALPRERFSDTPTTDANGMTSGTLTNGADFRFYSGSETQLPDPWLETVFGVGDTPAYLGRSYIVLENFEVGKYGSIPNFLAHVYNLNLTTAAECLDHLFQRVGLDPADFDVSNVDGFNVRGIPITNREPPRNTVDLIGTLFAFDVVETNGEILCIERGGAPSFAVTADDLGTVEVEGGDDPQSSDIPEQIQNELQLDQTTLPHRHDLNFYDPDRDGETNTAGVYRLESQALGFLTTDVNAVLTYAEALALSHRLLDTAWIESAGAVRFRVPHTFADDITAAAVGTVTRNGITHTVRVKEINGFVPGVLEVVGTVTRAASYTQTQITTGADAGAPTETPTPPGIPATTIATFIDRLLRDRELQDGQPGFYVAACSFGNGSWGGANAYVDRGNGFVFLASLSEQATMGTINATDATIAGASIVDVELYGEQTLPTGEPTYVLQGDLIYQYENATQLSTTPNLWRLDTLTNIGARCTTAENGSHAAGERFVLLNSALRFVPVESDEIGVARDYKVPTIGQDINDAGVINFTLSAPNIAVTTPSDWSMTAGSGTITHTWTPFSDDCVMTEGLIYEIRDDAAGSPAGLIYSGNSQPFVEQDLAAGTYTRHFRARTRFADGSYLMASITVTAGSGAAADFDRILVDPLTLLIEIDPITLNVLTES